jgi:SAM-dependent methyltransferase
MGDKESERERYDDRALRMLQEQAAALGAVGSTAIPPVLRAPYLFYEDAVRQTVSSGDRVLEIGSGTGMHTSILVRTGARVTATDIAPHTLEVLARNLGDIGRRVTRCVADMEALPFEDGVFDSVATAGCLSYGEPTKVDAEICRVIRPGGSFVCVDSLNHNPLYRFNRWLRCRRGDRSASTLRRMPDESRIRAIRRGFSALDVRYFGGFTWALSAIGQVIGASRAAELSDTLDRWCGVRRSAFKFVLVARGRR